MARHAPAALVAALLVATALAFAYTESLKLTPSPILGTRVQPKAIAPGCRCATDTASVSFRLRRADRLEIDIVRGRSDVVRTLVKGRRYPRGPLEVRWNGRDAAGQVVPEGTYRPRVRMLGQRRTIVLPNPIRVDTTPPVVSLVALGPRVFSPDGDRRADRVVVRYRVDEPARVSLLVGDRVVVRKRGTRPDGQLEWYGRVDGAGPQPGPYRLRLEATDVAGNLGRPSAAKTVVVRYVALGRTRIESVPGSRFAVLVLSDAVRVEWKLGARTGTARPGTLKLRAPLQPGRFTLTVTANGHSARAAVFVRSAAP